MSSDFVENILMTLTLFICLSILNAAILILFFPNDPWCYIVGVPLGICTGVICGKFLAWLEENCDV